MSTVMEYLIEDTDSYKASHYLQYPWNAQSVSSYIESRGGPWNETVFFGLQMFLKRYLSKPITQEEIDEMEADFTAHGLPFNRKGWMHILNKHGGYLPLEIQALPEGTVVAPLNALVQIRNTDSRVPWLTSYMETAILRAVWYPMTVATLSWNIKKVILRYLEETGDPAGIAFKLHDFGSRGVSSRESAAIGGTAHLVNFMGTDTFVALRYARRFYGEQMAGFSIPASEHSTMTCWGGERGEIDAMRNMLEKFGGKGPLLACVSDSYDIFNACENIWGGALKEEVINSGSTLVVRPDSGDPTVVPVQVIETLGGKFGFTVNDKGYKVLPDYLRVIQGDGVNLDSITQILENLKQAGWSADNIAFGMGGALLQDLTRDTMKFAMKASAIEMPGGWRDVYKDPVTDQGKRSKRGIQAVIRNDQGDLETMRFDQMVTTGKPNELRTVWKDGQLLETQSFAEIRELSTNV